MHAIQIHTGTQKVAQLMTAALLEATRANSDLSQLTIFDACVKV